MQKTHRNETDQIYQERSRREYLKRGVEVRNRIDNLKKKKRSRREKLKKEAEARNWIEKPRNVKKKIWNVYVDLSSVLLDEG